MLYSPSNSHQLEWSGKKCNLLRLCKFNWIKTNDNTSWQIRCNAERTHGPTVRTCVNMPRERIICTKNNIVSQQQYRQDRAHKAKFLNKLQGCEEHKSSEYTFPFPFGCFFLHVLGAQAIHNHNTHTRKLIHQNHGFQMEDHSDRP